MRITTCAECGEDFADGDFDLNLRPASKTCGPCRRGESPAKSDLDECYCGDYRKQHRGKTGACQLNGLGHHGAGSCRRFLLTGRQGWRQGARGGGREGV